MTDDTPPAPPAPPPPPPPSPTAKPNPDDPDPRPLLAPSEPRLLTDVDWQKLLTDEEFRVTRQKETETPYTGKYHNFRGDGTYHCSNCSTHLFDSDHKYNAGCGWPSFYRGKLENLEESEDTSQGMSRVEVTCKACGAHQGHVFDDGPEKAGGVRYCINSVSLRFKKKEEKK